MKKIKIDFFFTSSFIKDVSLLQRDSQQEVLTKTKNFLKYELDRQPLFEIEKQINSLLNMVSPIKHFEIHIDSADFDWKGFFASLERRYSQLVWLNVFMKQVDENKEIYSFEFIPLSKKNKGFPIEFNLEESLNQELFCGVDSLGCFIEELKKLSFHYIKDKNLIGLNGDLLKNRNDFKQTRNNSQKIKFSKVDNRSKKKNGDEKVAKAA